MPRIPIVAFDSSSLLPQNRPTAQVDTGIIGQTGRDLARIGQASEGAFQQMNAVHQQIQNGKFAVFAAQADTDFTKFATQEIENIKTAEDPTQAAQQADKRMREYLKTYLGAKEFTDEKGTVLRTDFPQWKYGQQNLNRMMVSTLGKLGEYSLAAKHEATRVEIDRTRGNTIRVLNELEQKGTPEDIQQGIALINAVGPAFKATEAAALEENLKSNAMKNAAALQIMADPNMALKNISERNGVFALAGDQDRLRMMATARTAIEHQETLRRQLLAEQEHLEKKRAEAIKQEGEDVRLRATIAATNGQYSVQQLDQEARFYRWSPEHYQHLKDLITNPKAMKSDPDTLQNAMLRSRSVNVSQRDRDQFATWYKEKRLSAEDYAKVDNEAQTNMNRLTDMSKTDLGRRHGQAEQNLRAALGIVGMLEKLDPVSKRVYYAAIDELTRRSSYMDGQEDPIRVAEEIVPKFQRILGDQAKSSVAETVAMNTFKTPEELEQAKPFISPQQYSIERKRLLDAGYYLSIQQRINEPVKPGAEKKSTGNPALKRETK